MTKRNVMTAAVLLVALSLGAQTLKIATTEQIQMFIPLMQKVLKDGGFESTITVMPMPRIARSLATGETDGAFFLSESMFSEIPGAVRIPVVLSATEIVAVTLNADVKVGSPADLRKYTVGIVQGNVMHEAATQGMKPQTTGTDEALFKMFASGRFQVALGIRQLVPMLAGQAGIRNYYVQEPPLLVSLSYFGLSSSKAELAPKLTALFKKWTDDGRWQKGLMEYTARKP